MSNRLDKTAADYIAIAVGPALIMMMVGSLVYFLLELYYQGDYEDRLQWILSCFVFAAVLIGRISIESGTARATLFALPLAISVGLAISVYVKHTGPLASIGLYLDWALLGLIWWCANKLTWDCTFIDEQQTDTGEGLLQTIGLDEEAKAADATPAAVAQRIAAQEAFAKKRRLEGTTGEEEEQTPKRWWERWLEGDQRPHSPGVWVVYFSLAALPIFGIGQLFIPAASEDRRQYVFRLLAVYVASGLGLLLTTSFLGMRRYLRQRYVEMPPLVAKKWIGIGCGLGLGLLVLAMILPRPNAEYAVSSLTGTIGSPQRQASRYAPPGGSGASDPAKQSRSTTTKGKDPRGKGTGSATKSDGGSSTSKTGDSGSSGKTSGGSDPGTKTGGGEPSGKTTGSSQPQGNGAAKTSTDLSPSKEPSSAKQPPDGGAKSQPSDERSKSPPGSEASKTPDGAEHGKTSASTDAKSPDGKPPTGKSSSGAAKSGATPDGEQSKSGENADGSNDGEEGKSEDGSQQDRSENSSGSGSTSPSSSFRPLESLGTALSWLPTVFKWVLQATVIAVVAYLVWRHRRELWAALVGLWTDLRNLLAGLFGGKKKERPAAQPSQMAPSGPQGRPFADYPNPYATGLAGRLSADQLVAYTFEALEAWARERGYPREADQTPLEFAAALASASAPLAEPVRLLALLYCQVAYAPGTLRAERTGELEYLWRLLSRGASSARRSG